jgi:hypothetical protein
MTGLVISHSPALADAANFAQEPSVPFFRLSLSRFFLCSLADIGFSRFMNIHQSHDGTIDLIISRTIRTGATNASAPVVVRLALPGGFFLSAAFGFEAITELSICLNQTSVTRMYANQTGRNNNSKILVAWPSNFKGRVLPRDVRLLWEILDRI